LDVAHYLAQSIAQMGPFDLWNDGSDIPVFAWYLKAGQDRGWTLYDLSDRLRVRGWQVPAYPMPDGLQDLTVQRIVVRNGVSMDLADRLVDDLRSAVAYLDQRSAPGSAPAQGAAQPAFHH
jgi:glutamate decarboxylase